MSDADLLVKEGDIAADYIEGLLDIIDVDGDIEIDVEGTRASVRVLGEGLQNLVGEKGDVLEAFQELTRLAVIRETGERSRLMLDIAGFREQVRANAKEIAVEAVKKAEESGEAVELAPMNAFERKVVHDVVAEAGCTSESEGEEPDRFIVVLPPSKGD
jgi:spoIIIJ-associated protein